MIELVLVTAVIAILAVISIPATSRIRAAAAVQNARHGVESTLALARASAIQYGRPSVFRIDAAGERVWVEVDTTVAGSGAALDTVGLYHLYDELRVDLESDRTALCFDGRGIATTGTVCALAGAQIVLSREGSVHAITVSATGRVVP